jgi:hypothetical protein
MTTTYATSSTAALRHQLRTYRTAAAEAMALGDRQAGSYYRAQIATIKQELAQRA